MSYLQHPNLNSNAKFGIPAISRDRNVIPDVVDPLGKHWEQPDKSLIVIYDTIAVMNQDTFDNLPCSKDLRPLPESQGKMWKAVLDDRNINDWYLVWYGFDFVQFDFTKGKRFTLLWRRIVIV